jgi:bifunctional non-homologous end joining protein LigD
MTRNGAAEKKFVVQEHRASRLHYDFRLEMDGVLRSWAVPKGMPVRPGIRRLAVQVDDHPLAYIDFEGAIPEGTYGAGFVKIRDGGTYALADQDSDEIKFVLHGKKLRGPYVLVRMVARPKDWLLMKMKGRARGSLIAENG